MGSSSSSNKDDDYTKNVKSIFLNEDDLGYREAFNIFDEDENHLVSKKEFDKIYGLYGSEQSDIVRNFNNENNQDDDIGYLQFKKEMEEITKEPPLNKKIENSFSVFDRGKNGYISKNQIRYLLSSIGDKLTEAEVNEFMLELNEKEENVNYSLLAEELCKNETK